MSARCILSVIMAVPLALSDCTKKVPLYGNACVTLSAAGSIGENPRVLSAVNLDILAVQLHYQNETIGNSGWVDLNANAGIYNVLMYRDERTAKITGSTKLLSGTINRVRVALGEGNSVFVSGEKEYTLSMPENILVEVETKAHIAEGHTLFLSLQFDPGSSVTKDRNGTFSLQPELGLKLSL